MLENRFSAQKRILQIEIPDNEGKIELVKVRFPNVKDKLELNKKMMALDKKKLEPSEKELERLDVTLDWLSDLGLSKDHALALEEAQLMEIIAMFNEPMGKKSQT